MTKGVVFNAILCLIMAILLVCYGVYVFIDERKKIKYYRKTFLYQTDWDKYYTMRKKQKRIILYKKLQLFWYKLLVKLKRLIIWN